MLCSCRKQYYPAHEQVRALVEKLYLIEHSNPPIWPGIDYNKAPLIIRFNQGGALLVGLDGEKCGFAPVINFFPDIRSVPDNTFFSTADFAPWLQLDSVINFTSCAGITYFSNYAPDEDMLFQNLMLHEYFHSYQQRYFKWQFPYLGRPAAVDPGQIALVYIEGNLLAKALLDKQNWRDYARQFVTLRNYRKQLADPYGFNAWEDHLEAIEGTARYFEIQTKVLPDKNDYFADEAADQRAAVLLMQEMDSWMLTQARQYSTGAAQGVLLDRAGVAWKSKVQDGFPLFSVFASAFPPEQNNSGLIARLKTDYGYAGLVDAAKSYLAKQETRYPLEEARSHIIIRTCGRAETVEKPLLFAPDSYKLEGSTVTKPFETMSINQPGVFEFQQLHSAAFASIKEKRSTGETCLREEIFGNYTLDDLSFNKNDCMLENERLKCSNLDIYGEFVTAHFHAPSVVKKTTRILEIEVL